MASLIKDPGGRFRVQVSRPDGSRTTIRLGKASPRIADFVHLRVEDLAAAKRLGIPPDPQTQQWLGAIDHRIYRSLETAQLVGPREQGSVTLEQLSQRMLAELDGEPQSFRHHEDLHQSLIAHLGAGRLASTITPAEALAFKHWLDERYAPATVSKRIQRCKQLFNFAIKRKMIPAGDNPFADIRRGSQVNRERSVYVDDATIALVLDACDAHPDPVWWRAVIALARYAGPRVPSELVGIEWQHIEIARGGGGGGGGGRIKFISPKTKRYDKSERWCPIVPKLRPHLEALIASVPPSKRKENHRPFVLATGTNLRTQLERIIKTARERQAQRAQQSRASTKPEQPALTQWPRLYHNLRASCQTDLEARFPTHVVCAWLGNTPKVATDHYLQVRDTDFEAATRDDTPSR
jgi:integrase